MGWISNTDVPRISLFDFNKLGDRRLWGFLNVKEEGLFSQNPFPDNFRIADYSSRDYRYTLPVKSGEPARFYE
jgi:hypothetical protein